MSRYYPGMTQKQHFQKFSSKLGEKTLKDLRAFAAEVQRPVAAILDEAVSDYLGKVRVREVFLSAASEVMEEHAALLKMLAK